MFIENGIPGKFRRSCIPTTSDRVPGFLLETQNRGISLPSTELLGETKSRDGGRRSGHPRIVYDQVRTHDLVRSLTYFMTPIRNLVLH